MQVQARAAVVHAVEAVAEYWMTERGEVQPKLVAAPRDWPTGDDSAVLLGVTREDLELRRRGKEEGVGDDRSKSPWNLRGKERSDELKRHTHLQNINVKS